MADKGAANRIADVAYHAQALRKIIKALMSGGWQAAVMEVLKHYWPYVLAVALVLILVPVIVFCCLPATMFGFENSTDAAISAMSVQADAVKTYYDKYEEYCKEKIEQIKNDIISNDTESNYEVVISGEPMAENWFISLHSVSFGNDLNLMTEQSVRDLVSNTIIYTVESNEDIGNTEETDDSETETEVTKILTISYLPPMEFMALNSYSDTDQNWVQLIYRTLQGEGGYGSGEFGSLFLDADWRQYVTSGYGYRTVPYSGFHGGVDIGMPLGTSICAVKDGKVKTAVYGTTGYGCYVVLDHGNGIETLYAHCSKLLVTEGQTVKQGDVIAKVGSTGNSTGPHCHFEVRINGEKNDPTAYLP